MYPETNTLPQQHTPSLQGGVVDYNARQWNYIETVSDDFLDELLKKVVVVFQNNNSK
jgi:hypothetical protein